MGEATPLLKAPAAGRAPRGGLERRAPKRPWGQWGQRGLARSWGPTGAAAVGEGPPPSVAEQRPRLLAKVAAAAVVAALVAVEVLLAE